VLQIFRIVEPKQVNPFAFATTTAALETKAAVLQTAVTSETKIDLIVIFIVLLKWKRFTE
jgi:hypothetical protein